MTSTPSGSIDLTGRPTLHITLKLTGDMKAALAQREVPAPEYVVLVMREATFREKHKFETEIKGKMLEDPVAWNAALLKSRCESDLPLAVFEELVWGMTETTLSQLQAAYMTGVLADPLLVSRAVTAARQQLSNAGLNALLNATSPSSPTGSAFDPGNATG